MRPTFCVSFTVFRPACKASVVASVSPKASFRYSALPQFFFLSTAEHTRAVHMHVLVLAVRRDARFTYGQ